MRLQPTPGQAILSYRPDAMTAVVTWPVCDGRPSREAQASGFIPTFLEISGTILQEFDDL